jgi:hypothetical protein
MVRRGECRFPREFTVRPHTNQVDEDDVCTSCDAILARTRAQIAAGAMFPPDTSGAIGDRIPVQPRPMNVLADCAACGEPFNATTNQQAYLGTEGRWRFVHETSCWTLLHSGLVS